MSDTSELLLNGESLALGGLPVLPHANLAWAEQFFTTLGRELGQLEQSFMLCWNEAQQQGLPSGRFTPELEQMFSRIAGLNTLGGDVLHQLRPSLPLDEATVTRWMSSPVDAAPDIQLTLTESDTGWLF